MKIKMQCARCFKEGFKKTSIYCEECIESDAITHCEFCNDYVFDDPDGLCQHIFVTQHMEFSGSGYFGEQLYHHREEVFLTAFCKEMPRFVLTAIVKQIRKSGDPYLWWTLGKACEKSNHKAEVYDELDKRLCRAKGEFKDAIRFLRSIEEKSDCSEWTAAFIKQAKQKNWKSKQ